MMRYMGLIGWVDTLCDDTHEPVPVRSLHHSASEPHRKPWYYTHVETALTKGGFDEYIPTRHYHHR